MLDMMVAADLPLQNQVILVAQKSDIQKNKKDISIGICQIVQGHLDDYGKVKYPTDLDEIGAQSPDPQTDAALYVFNNLLKDDVSRENLRNKYPDIFEPNESKVKVLKQPSHGMFYYSHGDAFYLPNQGYIGKDKLVANVEVGDYHITIHYFIHNGLEYDAKKICGKKGELWKIFTNPDGTPGFIREKRSLQYAGSDYALPSFNFASYNYELPTITFSNLTGAAVGETVAK